MSLSVLALLIVAGAAGGFVAGLVGVGGGVIFGPVLLFTFAGLGITDPVLAPLTLGSSLLCTLAASASGAVVQHTKGGIDWRTALGAGAFAAVAVVLMTLLVTTEPWYSRRVFQIVLGSVLVVVVVRMLTKKSPRDEGLDARGARRSWAALLGTGTVAGMLSSAAGVGGGVVLVPAFNSLMRLPLKVAAGTSTGAIVLITLAGVGMYAFLGQGAAVPSGAVGYIHVPYALALSAPAVIAARLGVTAAHRLNVKWVRWAFALVAALAAAKMLIDALA